MRPDAHRQHLRRRAAAAGKLKVIVSLKMSRYFDYRMWHCLSRLSAAPSTECPLQTYARLAAGRRPLS